MGRLRVPLADLDSEGRTVVSVGDEEIAVFLVDGHAHAVSNTCPHEGNPLVEGELLGRTLTCAYHSWKFDLETGACLFGEEAVRLYATEVGEAEIWIEIDSRPS